MDFTRIDVREQLRRAATADQTLCGLAIPDLLDRMAALEKLNSELARENHQLKEELKKRPAVVYPISEQDLPRPDTRNAKPIRENTLSC